MKIITYNINGIRSALQKDFLGWLKATEADIICLQEVKATFSQIPTVLFEDLGYTFYHFPAQKLGYSGVSILTKLTPKDVHYGMKIEKYDNEGRFIQLDFNDFSIISVYMPSGSSGEDRQKFKFEWLNDFNEFIKEHVKNHPKLMILGDFNICHQPIDIHNPKSNANSSGFLPEERKWMTDFLELGFVDAFRHLNFEPHHYTWWSYRANARSKNLGWRIDYQLFTKNILPFLKRAIILKEALHSDHCPVLTEWDFTQTIN